MPDRQDPPARPGRYPDLGPQPDLYRRPTVGRDDPAAGGYGRPQPRDTYTPPAPSGQRYRQPQRQGRPAPRDSQYRGRQWEQQYPQPQPGTGSGRRRRDLRGATGNRGSRDWLAGPARPGTRQDRPPERPSAPGSRSPVPQSPAPRSPGRRSPAPLDPLVSVAGRTRYPGADGTAEAARDQARDDQAALTGGFAVGGPDYRSDGGVGFDDDPDYLGFWEDDALPAGGGPARRSRGGGGRGGRGRPVRRPAGRKPRRGRQAAPIIALVILLAFVAGGGAVGYRLLRTYVVPPDFSGSGTGTAIVQITQGQSAHNVAQTLARLGVVASPRAFIKAVQADPQAVLDPGTYRLHRHMKASLALQLLLSPAARVQARVTIPEGWRLSQILAALGSKSAIPLSKYQAAAANPGSLGLPSYARGQLEGYLFPATYDVQPNMTAADVLRAMVQQFSQEASQLGVTTGARQVNLTPGQVITVASLVQAEAGRPSDFPKIARVVYNRLAAGMQLDLDSTVMYALHTYGIMATYQQIQDTNSPYNTYAHTGLPPGPICSPGAAAIQAALHPAAGEWIYFVTVDPAHGVTKFTASAAEFQQLRNELQQNLAKR